MNLRCARILVTNDDGINAPGLKVLEKIAKSISDDVWIVAPESEQSASGNSITLTLPLRVRKAGTRKFAVNGTPTDSVLLGVQHIVNGKKPDLVLSGVNAGGNLGEDITYSGTVAAAMEGTLLGLPSIALSQMRVYGENVRWGPTEKYAVRIIKKLTRETWPSNVLMNVNFPDRPVKDVGKVEVTVQGRRKIGSAVTTGRDPRGYDYVWIGAERNEDPSLRGSDLKAVNEGKISVTPLCLDLTHKRSMPLLRKILK
ncbi:MAG: 5'/3'-nucleotidase SurE [Rhodospirillaceae bacterium]|nr:5'/3'-nucleotidase SurE [Rhodospirillaceae bacterium]|tara:strand:+ start:3991 stop:4758 length:768 start_codon:yes stop_codon:yes gene_type:complete